MEAPIAWRLPGTAPAAPEPRREETVPWLVGSSLRGSGTGGVQGGTDRHAPLDLRLGGTGTAVAWQSCHCRAGAGRRVWLPLAAAVPSRQTLQEAEGRWETGRGPPGPRLGWPRSG